MAYNLQSLITILEQILNPQQTSWILEDHNKPQLESLLEKVVSLQSLFEDSSSSRIESLESQIREASHKAEDLIESHMVDQMLSDSEAEGTRFTFCTPDLQQVTHDLDCVKKKVVELEEVANMSGVKSSSAGASLPLEMSSNRVVVGIDEDLMQLKERLNGMSNWLEIIPIVGMGGIGKTTLARKLYEDPFILYSFDIRAWARISQDFNMREILLSLLHCFANIEELDQNIGNFELREKLQMSLIGRRYMIVLDDMWSVEVWDKIRIFFPHTDNGSRIVITTRLSNVADCASSESQQHKVRLLSNDQSWKLFSQIVFGEDECPYFLERIGRKIASDCRGLPLAINVVGGLLSKAEKSLDAWEIIGKNIGAIVESDDQFSNILSLSYNHLPNHLKPCFLYMGAFPEDYEIKASRLIRMWVAEGILKSNRYQSLEEVAEDCLKSLTDRNLLMITAYKNNGKPRRYIIHDLLRDLCMRKADEDKFHYIKNNALESENRSKSKRKMAYNLQSLITILERILNPQQTSLILEDHNKPQLESLLEKVVSLQLILEKSSSSKIESLESQIREASHNAEDLIESHMVDQMLSDSEAEGTRFTFCTPDLQQVTHDLDCVMKKVVELEEVANMSRVKSSSAAASLPLETSSNRVVVGVDEDLMQLKERLTGMSSTLEIIPIVGMGGIGKTTLARKLYEDPLILDFFDIRAWATISQDFNMREILLRLLHCFANIEELDQNIENYELGVKLHQSLFHRRYMIVLDDMWSVEAWNEIRKFFPDNDNRSRIVITTRLSNVAEYANSESRQHEVRLLSKDQSWNLLYQIVFGKDECPYFLERIGRKIASDCRGLPLAINVVGGLLSKAEKSLDAWENIGKDIGAIVESDDQFSNILSLSYNHLPNHLKPCFLYMGAFPEDYEIKASRLIRMWVAEGFLKSNGVQSLEEVAEDCLKSLTDRNLLMITAYKYNGKPRRYIIHDLLRDLCMRKADEDKFLYIKNNALEVTISNSRRVSVHTSYDMEDVYASTNSIFLARSFLCTGLMSRGILSPVFFTLRLLRVLDVMEMKFQKFPREIFQLVNLRYLAVFCYSSLPSGISRLRNLQTLIASFGWGDLPCEIWEMLELRHLKLNQVIWVDDAYTKSFVVQNMLQKISLVMVTPSLLRNGFFESIPNIKDLGIYCDVLLSTVVDLSHLHRLETLRCQSSRRHLLPCLKFPSILRKLTLADCVIFPGFLTTLCALPKLEVLNIKKCVFASESTCHEWEAAERDVFRSLRVLSLERLDLVHWRADERNFPVLEHLLLVCCYKLEEIPSKIAYIPTFKLLELYECSRSAEASARQIQEEFYDMDDYDFQLHIV